MTALHRLRALAAIFCIIVLKCAGQPDLNAFSFNVGDEQRPPAVKADLPYIRCGVCEAVAKQAHRMARAMRTAKKKVDESVLIEKLEVMCDVEKPDGEWITKLDLVEEGTALKVVDVGKPSKCNSECSTIARSCQALTEELDLTDISEALYAGKSRAQLTQLACYEATNACSKKAPPLPEDRPAGPTHKPLTPDEIDREKVMKQMKSAGLGGQMIDTKALLDKQPAPASDAGKDTPKGADTPKEGGLVDTVTGGVTAVVEGAKAAATKASNAVKGVLGKLGGLFDTAKDSGHKSGEL